MGRKKDGEGSTRQLTSGKWECVIQSKYINSKTLKPKRIKRVANTEEEAIKLCKQAVRVFEKQFEDGIDEKIDKKKTFGKYMEEYLEVIKSTLTQSGYYSYINSMKNNFFKYDISKMQLNMLSKKVFQDFYDELLTNKARKTATVPRQLCQRCCEDLVNRGLLEENYALQAKFRLEKVDEYIQGQIENEKLRKEIFTNDDIQKFYQAYLDNFNSEYVVVALFLLETGLRLSEFVVLQEDDIDLEKKIIYVRKARARRFKDNNKDEKIETYIKVTKNTEERIVPISSLCEKVIKDMMKQTKLKCKNNPYNYIYPTFRTGEPRSSATCEVGFKSLCDKLGIDRDVRLTPGGQKKGLCLHSLRHTFNSIANSQKGANIVNTALVMGHKSLESEKVYIHQVEDSIRQVTTPSQILFNDNIKDYNNNKDDDEILLELLKKSYTNTLDEKERLLLELLMKKK